MAAVSVKSSIGIRNPGFTDKESETSPSGIHGVESRIQDWLEIPDVLAWGEIISYLFSFFIGVVALCGAISTYTTKPCAAP